MTADPGNIFIVAHEARTRRDLIDALDDPAWELKPIAACSELAERIDAETLGAVVIPASTLDCDNSGMSHDLVELGLGLPVVVTVDSPDVAQVVRLMRAGASDVVDLSADGSTLRDRVVAAMALSSQHAEQRSAMLTTRTRLARLTPRERQLLDEVISGLSNKQIAAEWRVSERTVANHRANLLEKMRAVNTADLVRMAVQVRGSMPARSQ